MNGTNLERFVNAVASDLEEGGFREVTGTRLRRNLTTAVEAALPMLSAHAVDLDAMHAAACVAWNKHQEACRITTVTGSLRKVCEALIASQLVSSAQPLQLDRYDAGLLSDVGGGDTAWWLDYLRTELGRAHDHYQHQVNPAKGAGHG
ncbi:TPA: hypothetical protein ACOEQZ_001280 [Stenotrophomonas maltophilia]